MIRKDTTLDPDRPHYYSQFWIDVAMGKRDIGGPRTVTAEPDVEADEDLRPEPVLADMVELEPEPEPEPEPEVEAPVARTPAPKKAEPKKQEPARPSLSSLADLAKIEMLMRDSAQMDDDTVPDIEQAVATPIEDEAIVTNFSTDTAGYAAEEEPVESLDEQIAAEGFDEDFEEEEEDEWGSGGPRRGSKPNKRRREPRRDF